MLEVDCATDPHSLEAAHLHLFPPIPTRTVIFSLEVFVDFAKVLNQIRSLPANFHKYYFIYKFFEFMPYLNLSQVSH